MTKKSFISRNDPLRIALLAATALMAMCEPSAAAAEPAAEKPVLRVPKMAAPPTIDGKIDDEEWASASAVTGFTSVFAHDQYPADMRGVWRLGYDDENLYLAMHMRFPEGVVPNAQTKSLDDMDFENTILFGDHVEIQITPHTAQRAMQTGFGFYKWIVNPFDIWSDYWHYCDEPGNESAWSSDARVKSTFDLNNWWLEMAIPIIGTMKSAEGGVIKKADGLELIMQLVNSGSCAGYSFAGWVPDVWVHWDSFYRVILDPDAPVMQLLETGDLVDGKLDATIRLRDKAGRKATVTLDVTDVNGKRVFGRSEPLALTRDRWSVAEFREPALDVPPFEKAPGKNRNYARLRVEADGKTIYTADMPFTKHTPERRADTYDEYVNSLPKGDYTTKIAYIPGNGKFRATVNTDVLGDLPQAVRDAKQFRLRITSKQGGKAMIDKKLPIVNGIGSHLLDLGPLEGEFAVTIDLLDAKGKAVSTREHSFARVKHEWEGNTIGKERVVIPPFGPLVIDGDTVKSRLATLAFGQGGLWQSATVKEKSLLTAPMRIEGVVDGRDAAWQGESLEIVPGEGRAFPAEFDHYDFLSRDCPKLAFDKLPETNGYDARISGRGKVGAVAMDVKATVDYDGYTLFNLTYGPQAAAVTVDRLEIVLELFPGANGVFASRGVGAEGYRTLPKEQQGTLWESASVKGRHPRFKGNFMPLLQVGDGEYGLQFRAASDEGWLIDDDISCMKLERQGDALRLRLLLVNAPATLDKTRSVTFALMPLPAKDAPANSRYNTWGSMDRDFAHSATGWRKYGTGVNNWYLPSDDDYVRLGEEISAGRAAGRRIPPQIAGTKPVLMYSSTVSSGAPQPECDSFLGQWHGDSEVVFQGAIGWKDAKSPTGHPWDKPECWTETRPVWDEDLDDNYMWFHRKLTALSQTNGAYYDNAEVEYWINLDAGTYGYVRDDGHIQPTCNVFQRRRLMKRLYTMGWLEGKPPLHNSKWPFQTPFQTFNYMWEGNWHIYAEDGTFYDAHGRDLAQLRFFRDSIETPAFIHQQIPRVNDGVWDDRGARSYFALAILHDIGIDKVSKANSELLRSLDEQIGFLDREAQAEFIPYWRAEKLARPITWRGQEPVLEAEPSEDLYISVYRSRIRPTRSVLWVVNTSETDRLTGLQLDAEALTGTSRPAVIVRDLETGVQLRKDLPATIADEQNQETLWRPFLMRARSFRALLVEEGTHVAPTSPQWP